MNKLHDYGITVTYQKHEYNVKSGLVVFCGDTLAANIVGNFNKGVGFAYKVCSFYDVTSNGASEHVCKNTFTVRDEDEYKQRCALS